MRYQVDVASERLNDFIYVCDMTGVHVEILEMEGPGGGNPLVEVSTYEGSDVDLRAFMSEVYDPDFEIDEHLYRRE